METGAKYRLQRRVGIVVGGVSLFFALVNAVTLIAAFQRPPFAVLASPFVGLLLIVGLCSIPTIVYDHELLRALQTLLFVSMGLLIIFADEPVNFGAIAFFIYGLLLALRYGFFERRASLKFVLSAILLLFACAAALWHHVAFEAAVLETTVAAVCFLYLLWITFTDEIDRYREESERLRHEATRNQIFIRFGRHTAGIVHNVKSKLMSIEGFNDLIAEAIGGSETGDGGYAALQRLGIEQLHAMVDGLLLAVRSYQRTAPEIFSLSKVVQSAVEVARANRQVRAKIRFDLELCEGDDVLAIPLSTIQILDALIQNAWEAASGAADPTVSIWTRGDGAYVLLGIRDRGPGLPFCIPCEHPECLTCANFRIGRSTKPGGSGIGVAHAQLLLREMGGRLEYRSGSGVGTSVLVRFPRPAQRASD